MSKLFILGDLAIEGATKEHFDNGNRKWFLEGLDLDENTFNTVNLESPLIQRVSPIPKLGPNLGHVAQNADALVDFDLVGLGNNHILDHGEAGLRHTLNLLDHSKINHLGAGVDINAAGAPRIVELGEVKVGFVNWCHHEFCIASENSAGAFPLDVVKGTDVIKELKTKCDFIILFYHGGIEHFPYPSPMQRELCQYLSSIGVDLITCQHSHIIGASEYYGDSFILYGQGNYSFLCDSKHPHWNQGLMLEVECELNRPIKVNLIPITNYFKDQAKPNIASETLRNKMIKNQAHLSEVLLTPKYDEIWRDFCRNSSYNFMLEMLPVGRFARRILKFSGVLKSKHFRDYRLRVLNKIECEAHSEAFIAGLKISND